MLPVCDCIVDMRLLNNKSVKDTITKNRYGNIGLVVWYAAMFVRWIQYERDSCYFCRMMYMYVQVY